MVEPNPHGSVPLSVPRGKAPRRGLDSGLVLGHDGARGDDSPRKLGVTSRVVPVNSAAEHRDRPPASLQRPAVRLAVDAAGKAADHDDSRSRQLA